MAPSFLDNPEGNEAGKLKRWDILEQTSKGWKQNDGDLQQTEDDGKREDESANWEWFNDFFKQISMSHKDIRVDLSH